MLQTISFFGSSSIQYGHEEGEKYTLKNINFNCPSGVTLECDTQKITVESVDGCVKHDCTFYVGADQTLGIFSGNGFDTLDGSITIEV